MISLHATDIKKNIFTESSPTGFYCNDCAFTAFGKDRLKIAVVNIVYCIRLTCDECLNGVNVFYCQLVYANISHIEMISISASQYQRKILNQSQFITNLTKAFPVPPSSTRKKDNILLNIGCYFQFACIMFQEFCSNRGSD